MPDTMSVIAGILNAVFDMIILMIYLKCILQNRKEVVSGWGYCLCFFMVCGIQYGLGWFEVSWIFNMLCSLSGLFFLTLLYTNKMMTRIFAVLSFQVFAMVSELFCYATVQFLRERHFLNLHEDSAFFLSKLVLFMIVIFISGFFHKDTALLEWKDYLPMLVTPMVSILVIITIMVQYEGSLSNSGTAVFLSNAGIIVINFIVYYLLQNTTEAAQIRERQTRMEAQFAFQEKKYEQAFRSFQSISSIIHDTNKHLLYVRECILQSQPEEAVEYINQALDAVDRSYKRFHTGNLVIDALMSNAANTAGEEHIKFQSDIRIVKDKINIERYDLCVVLGNLLDNAIEACRKVTDYKERYTETTIVTTDTALIIRVENSAQPQNLVEYGYTDKKDKGRHGYGLQNIRGVADQYGGTFHFEYRNTSFEASVILPFKDL